MVIADSLCATLDLINDALLVKVKISEADKLEISQWIAGRQGVNGTYAGMPAPTDEDFTKPIRKFTGEPFFSKVSISHILGQEACRILILLGKKDMEVIAALKLATHGMLLAIDRQNTNNPDRKGTYCCGSCTPAYWRHLAAGGLENAEQEIEFGMRVLKAFRLPDGKWHKFSSNWTISALVEIGAPAREELKHAAKIMELAARYKANNDIYMMRRKLIAERGLAII